MEEPQVNIQIDLGGLPGRIQRVLKAATNLVAIGLNALDSISPGSFALPDVAMHHHFDSNNPWSTDFAKETWKQWILRNGFRDAAEAISGILEEVQGVLSYWYILQLQTENGEVTVGHWNEIVVARAHKFHKRTLPQKIEFLEKHYAFMPDPSLLRQVFSIHGARNCFVHRNGIVAEIDTTDSKSLELEWSALVAIAVVNGQEQEVVPPQLFEAGTSIGVATRPRRKNTPIGQSLEVNTTEFAQICWTLFLFAQTCAMQLEAYGKERGVEFNSNAT